MDTPNYERAFAERPAVYAAWQQLNASIKSGMDLRRYELATVAAARRLRSTYCVVAHGSAMLDHDLIDAGGLSALVADPATAPGLSDLDRAVIALAEQVVDDATAITETDLDALRAHGLSDADVFDVIAAAAARCFFSKTLDATLTRADARYATTLGPELAATLTVGRPIADG